MIYLSARELRRALELDDTADLRAWLARLQDLGLVQHSGRTQATRYFVRPELLGGVGLDEQTTLGHMEPHRLRELILEDLRRFPDSGRADIHRRIGPEINEKRLSRALRELVDQGQLVAEGKTRWTTYCIAPDQGQRS